MSKSEPHNVRDSRYELIRIVSMLIILASHCVKFTLGDNYAFLESERNINYYVAFITVMFGNVGTYLFIILTCWFSIDKVGFKADRFLRTVWQIWTTSVLCVIIARAFHIKALSLSNIFNEFITPFYDQYWFATVFCVFILVLPLLQMMVQRMDEKKLGFTCIVLLIVCSVRGIYNTEILGQIGDFFTVFFVMSYLKKHPDNWLEKHNKLGIAVFVLFVLICLIAGAILPENLFGKNINGGSGSLYNFVIRSLRLRTIFQLGGAISIFYAFIHIRLTPSHLINTIAKPGFGVYLWHYNIVFRDWLWQEVCRANFIYSETNLYFLLLIIGPVIIYGVFAIVEAVRAWLLDEHIYVRLSWNRRIAAWMDEIYKW